MKHFILAFTGPKGSGKDTVASLVERFTNTSYQHVERVAFADPIKHHIQQLFGLDTTGEYDQFKRSTLTFQVYNKDHVVSARHVVREIGMKMRAYDDRQFTDYVHEVLQNPRARVVNSLFLITDLRFDNEYLMLMGWGAKVVKIVRPDHQYDGHITERGFDDHLVDYILHNDGQLADLEKQVYKMIRELGVIE